MTASGLTMIVQIIGPPASGKSYIIKNYLKRNKNSISYFDIASYNHKNSDRIKHLKHDIYKCKKKNIILESACGVKLKDSCVVKYNKDKTKVFANFLKREKYIDTNYLSILEDMEIKPNYIVTDEETMHTLLDYLFKKKRR